MPIQRKLKNIVKNYTDIERKVREATSNDPWGPASNLMAELSDMSYNVMAFTEMMQMLWKRLNEKQQRHWRHVFKALLVMEYLIKTGSERVATQCRDNIHCIETLLDFQFVEDGRDHGQNIRVKAKDLMELLRDPQLLASERVRAMKAKERLSEQVSMAGTMSANGGASSSAAGLLTSPARYSFRRMMSPGKDSGNMSSTLQTTSGSATLPHQRTMFNNEENIFQVIQNLEDAGFRDVAATIRHGRAPPVVVTSELEAARPRTQQQEEEQLQAALAMSREEHERETRVKREQEEALRNVMNTSRQDVPVSTNGPPPPVASPPVAVATVPINSGTPSRPPGERSVPSRSQHQSDRSTVSSSSSRSKNTPSTWDPVTGAKLFDMVDTSLSVAPANAPHPWDFPNTVPSPFPTPVEAWIPSVSSSNSSPVAPGNSALSAASAGPGSEHGTASVTDKNGGNRNGGNKEDMGPEGPSFFGEFCGLVNLSGLSEVTAKSTNPFTTTLSSLSHPNPFLEPVPSKNSLNELRGSPAALSEAAITAPFPSQASNTFQPPMQVHPSNPWYPPSQPPAPFGPFESPYPPPPAAATTANHHPLNPFL